MSCTQSATFMSSLEHFNSAIKTFILKTTRSYSVQWVIFSFCCLIHINSTDSSRYCILHFCHADQIFPCNFFSSCLHSQTLLTVFVLTLCVINSLSAIRCERYFNYYSRDASSNVCAQNTKFQMFIDFIYLLCFIYYLAAAAAVVNGAIEINETWNSLNRCCFKMH